MSEPKSRARTIERVSPDILNWHLQDERIGSRGDAYAVLQGKRSVLIDPLPLTDTALAELGAVEAICLTGSCHQRSAWRYRTRFGVKVHAPEGAEGLDETPDAWYVAGGLLPGGLEAVHAPGPTEVHFALHLPRGDGVLFCADVLVRDGDRLHFVPDEYQDAPAVTRDTARRFLDLRFGVLCCSHGGALTRDPHAAIKRLLEEEGRPKGGRKGR
ncbi:MAG TPA: MBL fold metallo-hydrolase, partial [Candidatus Polarisedimenticolia bacterium]|nr:MBL fold metallo-hydrolase [Candidatus Polarisedimenticolia bacterium]